MEDRWDKKTAQIVVVRSRNNLKKANFCDSQQPIFMLCDGCCVSSKCQFLLLALHCRPLQQTKQEHKWQEMKELVDFSCFASWAVATTQMFDASCLLVEKKRYLSWLFGRKKPYLSWLFWSKKKVIWVNFFVAKRLFGWLCWSKKGYLCWLFWSKKSYLSWLFWTKTSYLCGKKKSKFTCNSFIFFTKYA